MIIFLKIRINYKDDLPLEKTLKMYNVVIRILSVFNGENK